MSISDTSQKFFVGCLLIFAFANRYIICVVICNWSSVSMDSKEIGFLFRIALTCALDSTKSISLGEPDDVSKKIMSLILNHLDLIESADIIRMFSMIYSYFNSDYGAVLADSISVEDFITLYENPRKTDNYKAFADLLLEELKKRTNE